MPLKIITGGQAGADQGAWRAARALGLATGGWMPRGFRTEAGPRPEFAAVYGATEHPSVDYPDRTLANIALADLTLVFNHGPSWSPGTDSAITKACARGIPSLVVELARTPVSFRVARLHRTDAAGPTVATEATTDDEAIDAIRAALTPNGGQILHIGGNGEASTPGIGAFVERFLIAALGGPPSRPRRAAPGGTESRRPGPGRGPPEYSRAWRTSS